MAATHAIVTGRPASRRNRPRWQASGAATVTARNSQTKAANQAMMAESTAWWSRDRSIETTPDVMTIVHEAGGTSWRSCSTR